MENIVSLLAGNPLPVTLSVVTTVALLAIFWFFVLPLLDEVKKLRSENSKLKEESDRKEKEDINSVLAQILQIKTALTHIKETIADGGEEEGLDDDTVLVVDELVQAVTKLHELMEGHTVGTASQVQEMRNALHHLIEQMKNSSTREEALDRLMREVHHTLLSIGDKQSQIIGALYGMSQLHDRNRSI